MDIEKLQTGDMILYNGDYFISRIVEYFTHSIYSHVAVVIRNPFFDNKFLDGIYVLESGYENTPDPENHRKKFGVQLTKLEDMMKKYMGKIFVRKLHCSRDGHFYRKIQQIHSDVHNIPYDINPFDWIRADLNINIGNTQKRNTYWCSALVAYFYVKLGFLDKDLPWSLISPQDLSSSSSRLHFHNCVLDNDTELYIK